MTTRERFLTTLAAAALLGAPAPPGHAQAPAGTTATPQTNQIAPDRQAPPAAQAQPAGPARDAMPGRAPGATNGNAAGAATGTLAVDSGAIRSGRRASKVIGSAVYNENNESIGEVDDILIPPGGAAPIAVISVGGFLGIGAKLVAVPYERLQAAGSGGNRWTLTGATKDSLGSLPTFNYDNTAEKRG